jgi:hypothetical protein
MSAFSAGNSGLFAASRVLYGLALRRQAPKFLTTCTSSGLPYVAVLVSVCLFSGDSGRLSHSYLNFTSGCFYNVGFPECRRASRQSFHVSYHFVRYRREF